MKTKNQKHRRGERGIALITVLLALLLLSVMALGAMYMTNMETGVNANFRTQQVAYFAARAGLEEVRARLRKADPNSLYALVSPGAPYDQGMVQGPLTQVPTGANGAVLYVLNEGNQPGSVQPWNINNQYVDDEICHEGYTLPGLQAQNSIDYSVRCTTIPNGNGWYRTATSTAPWSGTSAALSWKWVRVAMKLNGSQQNYVVNPAVPIGTPTCFNGSNEEALVGQPQCYQLQPTSMNQVFLVTVLAVTPTGARRMVQSEIALQPVQPIKYGLFATGPGCGALQMGGGGTTDAYNSALGAYGAPLPSGGINENLIQGSVGSNGNVGIGGTSSGTLVGGSIGAGGTLAAAQGACAGSPAAGFAYTTSGNGTGVAGTDPNNPPQACSATVTTNCIQSLAQPYVVDPPPAPSPAPPTTNKNITQNTSLTPGTYGNLNIGGGAVVTITPGTYNLNSITLAGGASIIVNPPGAVVFNIAGSNLGTNAKAVDLTGGSVSNGGASALPMNFEIEYAGTAKVAVGGSSASYMTVLAPNASVTLAGGADFYGAIIGKSVTDTGGAKFHYDVNSAFTQSPNGYFTLLAFRESFY